jgi:2-polyprenyl-3-methyl-5-hydroxy-6-metoxy-1,4-benzoquinol methylase
LDTALTITLLDIGCGTGQATLPIAWPGIDVMGVDFSPKWLDATGHAALARDMENLWIQHNQATDGTTFFGAEYLEVQAVRA